MTSLENENRIKRAVAVENKLQFTNKGTALVARDHEAEREVCVTILETENDAAVLAMSLMAVLRATPVSFAPFGKESFNLPNADADTFAPFPTVRDEDTQVEYPNTDSDTIESETVGS